MRRKAVRRDAWETAGGGDGLLVHLEQAALSESNYGLAITLPHYGRLMSAHVAG